MRNTTLLFPLLFLAWHTMAQKLTPVEKNIIDAVDHSLILNNNYPVEDVQKISEVFCNIVWVGYQPTSENLLADFAGKIIPLLPQGVKLFSLRLRETANSYAEWYAADNI